MTPTRIIELLEAEYATIPWRPAGDPVAELVLTLLSQHTSDSNSGRAFIRLLSAFPDWRSLLDADVKAIDAALAKMTLSAAQMSEVKQLRDRGEAEHGAGNHADAVNSLAEAMRIILNSM